MLQEDKSQFLDIFASIYDGLDLGVESNKFREQLSLFEKILGPSMLDGEIVSKSYQNMKVNIHKFPLS